MCVQVSYSVSRMTVRISGIVGLREILLSPKLSLFSGFHCTFLASGLGFRRWRKVSRPLIGLICPRFGSLRKIASKTPPWTFLTVAGEGKGTAFTGKVRLRNVAHGIVEIVAKCKECNKFLDQSKWRKQKSCRIDLGSPDKVYSFSDGKKQEALECKPAHCIADSYVGQTRKHLPHVVRRFATLHVSNRWPQPSVAVVIFGPTVFLGSWSFKTVLASFHPISSSLSALTKKKAQIEREGKRWEWAMDLDGCKDGWNQILEKWKLLCGQHGDETRDFSYRAGQPIGCLLQPE